MIRKVGLSDLVSDKAFQPRIGLDEDHVDSMVQALQNDATTFDETRIHVWSIAGKLFIVDGHHRFAAFKRMKKTIGTIEVKVHESERSESDTDQQHEEKSRTEALRHAITANNHHGSPLKRSRKDNQRAVELLLANPASRQLSDAKIAEIVGVTGPTVAKIRKANPEYQSDSRVTADGRVLSAEKQSAGAEKRKKSEPAPDTSPVEPELHVVGEESSGPEPDSPGFESEPADEELTPEQVEERRRKSDEKNRKFLDELFDVNDMFSPEFRIQEFDSSGKRIQIYPYLADGDFSWIDDRKLCSAVLDPRIYPTDRHEFVTELVRRFLKVTTTTSSAVIPGPAPEVSPAEPEPADEGKRKFDWTTEDGIRESMRYTISRGFRFPRWCQNYRLKDKRKDIPDFPDDDTLRKWFDELSA